jgi:hypothetical protein
MWTKNKSYSFVPSGDAEEFVIEIIGRAPAAEAIQWYQKRYRREDFPDFSDAYKAIVREGGQDADLMFKRGEVYYVFDTDFESGQEVDETYMTRKRATIDALRRR